MFEVSLMMGTLIYVIITVLLLYYYCRDLACVAIVPQATREMGKSAPSLASVLLTMGAVIHLLTVWTTLVSKIKFFSKWNSFTKHNDSCKFCGMLAC